jgi:hypothetical protein
VAPRKRVMVVVPLGARFAGCRCVLCYGESGSGASLDALAVASLTGKRVFRGLAARDRWQLRSGALRDLSVVMPIGCACVC